MKTKLKWFVVALFVVFIGLQFTSPARTNPSFDEKQTLQSLENVPPEVSNIFARSCNDCHSNQTNWRWYTHIAPVSWFVVGHVNDGRADLNFSEWGSYSERMRETRLKAVCALVEKDRMPLESYVWVHSEADLSANDAKIICDWSKTFKSSINSADKSAN
jgi:lysozyme family protein